MIITLSLCIKAINYETILVPHESIVVEVINETMESMISIDIKHPRPPLPKFISEVVSDEILPINTPILEKVPVSIQSQEVLQDDFTVFTKQNKAPLPLPIYEQKVDEISTNKVVTYAEQMPLIKACIDEDTDYSKQLECTRKKIQEIIKSKLRYPLIAKENGYEGTVVGSFIIDLSGEIVELKIERKRGLGLDEAVLEVMKHLPTFQAGKQNQQKVRVKMYLPIKFKLNN